MSEESSNRPDQFPNNSEEVSANLSIFVDNEGNIAYNCDWDSTEEGLIGVASIFYKLILDDLPARIFEEIKEQCVLNNAENDFIAIEGMLQQYSSVTKDEDSVVIPPDKITNL
jgi:hypothetical protein